MRFVIALLAVLIAWLAAGRSQAETAVDTRLPDLSVRVLPRQGTCTAATSCVLSIHVLNEGNGAFDGQVAVILDLQAPAVLPNPRSEGPCTRLDYGKFRCVLPAATYAPGQYSTVDAEFLFLSAAFPSSNACASIDWSGDALAPRERLLSNAIKGSEHGGGELSAAAGLPAQGASHGDLAAALLGAWGAGDAREANDKGCAAIRIASSLEGVICGAGQALIEDRCVAIANWCPSNLRPVDEARCGCPADAPNWNAKLARCDDQAAALDCPSAEQDALNSCRCPAAKPVFNTGKQECVALAATTALATPAPAPAKPPEPSPEISAPAKAKPPCGQGADGACAVEASLEPPAARPAKPAPKAASHLSSPKPTARHRSAKPDLTENMNARKQALGRHGRRCSGLSVWGARRHRCVFLPFVVTRVLRPWRP